MFRGCFVVVVVVFVVVVVIVFPGAEKTLSVATNACDSPLLMKMLSVDVDVFTVVVGIPALVLIFQTSLFSAPGTNRF